MHININEKLTKENFFDEVAQEFPKSMKLFSDWIDEYKKKIQWDKLFGSRNGFARPDWNHAAPKFHEIPFEMQQGIWLCFVHNTLDKFYEQPEYQYYFDLAEDIKLVFGELEPLIN